MKVLVTEARGFSGATSSGVSLPRAPTSSLPGAVVTRPKRYAGFRLRAFDGRSSIMEARRPRRRWLRALPMRTPSYTVPPIAAPFGDVETFRRANVASTAEVLEACRRAQVRRLVHVSTPSVYFEFRDRLGICESEALPPPVNEYARTKAEGEALVRRFVDVGSRYFTPARLVRALGPDALSAPAARHRTRSDSADARRPGDARSHVRR